MPLLHIEPEELRITARRLTQMADEIDWQVQRMENARQILQTTWKGNGRLQFQEEMDHRLHTLHRLSYEISGMSLRLQSEANKWEEVSCWF